ncbi:MULTISPECIES: ABC transporter permease [Pontibacillus]|uniref:ABC transporter permease n=1 Tax=Pontibacillus chungwhensis TaxID=265426 RepID=A0ABY8V683_9BACI|nr:MULTISPECIES: ABC transporter permease [Pontibacillus]MCD5322805.1 ABC transporter permease [Pontibacillus sp. HN14]WIG00075.1 ABC transporter permease [Pontibacillus chungwhensis]
MWIHAHKDWKRMLKDPKALLIVLFMPALLTALLGLSIGKMMDGSGEIDTISLGVFDQSEPATWNIEGMPEEFTPSDPPNDFVALFKEEVLKGEELKSFIHIEEIESEEEGKERLQNGELTSFISFPASFNQNVVDALLLSNQSDLQVDLWQNPDQALQSEIIASIVEGYTTQLTSLVVQKEGTMRFLAEEGLSPAITATKMQDSFEANSEGGNRIKLSRASIDGLDSISGIQYYTVGMAVMFMLYVASYTAIYMKDEVRTNMFNRIRVIGESPYKVLAGKLISTSIFVFGQFLFLFTFSKILFGMKLGALLPLGILMVSTSIAVGCLGVVFSALALTYKENRLTDLFQSVVIPFMAMLGGSFIQLSIMPESIRFIGQSIINGAALDGLLKIMQGYGFEGLQSSILAIWINGFIFLLLAFIIIRRNKEVFS